ncbi:MAG: SDR family oxidoreductase [Bacteroidales bacterium]|nr:SDR family oxidoreductase [Bacteroidales bacterium]
MKGKIVLITGSTDGIGKHTATELIRMGAEVITHGRNKHRGKETAELMGKYSGNGVPEYVNADLSSLSRVKSLAATIHSKYDHIDVLINNAGIFSREQTFTPDGIETTFAVNHLAHFSLSLQLLPLLLKSEQGRIITVSSMVHKNSPRISFDDLQEINSYMDYSAYALSKLANVLFSVELAQKLHDTNVTSNSLHPGVINTKLLKAGFGLSGDPVEEGSQTSVYLASADIVSDISGKYFVNSREVEASPYAYNPGLRKNLWKLSEELCELKFTDFM